MSQNVKVILTICIITLIGATIIVFDNITTTKYSIVFDTNGGTKIPMQTIKYERKVKRPEDPTKDGYTFVEWQLNEKTYDFNAKVTKSMRLTATWK